MSAIYRFAARSTGLRPMTGTTIVGSLCDKDMREVELLWMRLLARHILKVNTSNYIQVHDNFLKWIPDLVGNAYV
jgi:hypothetical protein